MSVEISLDIKTLLEAVRARRARRAPAIDSDDHGAVEAAQRRLGWAPHSVVAEPVALSFARSAASRASDYGSSHLASRCVEAVFDGYELACLLTGVGGDGHGRVVGRGGSLLRLISRAGAGAAALAAGPLAGVIEALSDEARRGIDPSEREDVARAVAYAVAGGIALHVAETGVSHAAYASLLAAMPPDPFDRVDPPVEVPPQRAPPNPALLDAILAAPDDDGPRLVYADWLSEHEDPRGELIQLQCTMARAAVVDDAMRGRERALLRRYEPLWRAESPSLRSCHWRRGFIAEGVADATGFARALPLLARTPLERVQLTDVRRANSELFATLAPHPTLHALDLSPNQLDPRGLAILDGRWCEHVQTLDLKWARLERVDGARALARIASTTLPRLTRLRLSETRLDDVGLEALAEAPLFARLTRLDLHAVPIGTRRAAEAIVRASSLEELELTQVTLGEDAAATLVADAPPSLRTIALTPESLTARAHAVLRARFAVVPALSAF